MQNRSRKRKREKIPNVKWTDYQTKELFSYLKTNLDNFEKPTAQVFYTKAIRETAALRSMQWDKIRQKVRNFKAQYLKAQELQNKLLASKKDDPAVQEYISKTWPYWEQLHEILPNLVGNYARKQYAGSDSISKDHATTISSAEDYEDASYEESMYNTSSADNNDYCTNDTSSLHNEFNNEDIKVFEPIILTRLVEHQQSCEPMAPSPPSPKRLRIHSIHSMNEEASEKRQAPASNAAQLKSLCEMIKTDLEFVSEELFFAAKWKIMDVLQDVHRKHLTQKQQGSICDEALAAADTSSAIKLSSK